MARIARVRWQLLLFCTLVTLVATSGAPAGAFPVKSWYESRWEGVHRQETDASCGPASIVTLLETYFDIRVDEADVFELATRHLTDELGAISLPYWAGTSLRGLRDALNALGFQSVGVRISFDELLRYFDEAGLPVIAHLTLPERHFVVVVGKVGTDSILVADPSHGYYVLPRFEAIRRFSGNILLYEPPRPIREEVVAHQLRSAELLQRFSQHLINLPGRRRQ